MEEAWYEQFHELTERAAFYNDESYGDLAEKDSYYERYVETFGTAEDWADGAVNLVEHDGFYWNDDDWRGFAAFLADELGLDHDEIDDFLGYTED